MLPSSWRPAGCASTKSSRCVTSNRHERARYTALALAFVSGSVWFAAAAAVLLFRGLGDSAALAGQLAASIFEASYYLCAAVTCIALVTAPVGRILGAGLLLTVGLLVLGVVPALRSHGQGWPGSFASLHALASALHLALAIGTLLWAIWLARWQRLRLAG